MSGCLPALSIRCWYSACVWSFLSAGVIPVELVGPFEAHAASITAAAIAEMLALISPFMVTSPCFVVCRGSLFRCMGHIKAGNAVLRRSRLAFPGFPLGRRVASDFGLGVEAEVREREAEGVDEAVGEDRYPQIAPRQYVGRAENQSCDTGIDDARGALIVVPVPEQHGGDDDRDPE